MTEASLHDPALRHDLEGVQFAALCDLYRDVLAQYLAHALCKGLARVSAVAQHTLSPIEPGFATLERLQRPFAIRHLCRGHHNGVRQTLGVYRNVALDARDLFACVIPF